MFNLLAFALLLSSIIPSSADAKRLNLTQLELLTFRMELGRFPNYAECRRQIDRADRHLAYIDEHILLFHYDRDVWTEYRAQVEAWRGLWYDLSFCQAYPTIQKDLCRMQRLRAAIGEENWAAGYVPPAIASYLADKTP